MKINFILADANMGGGTRVIATHAMNLQARGHEVRAFTTPRPRAGMRLVVKSLLSGAGWPTRFTQKGTFFDGSSVPLQFIDRYRPIRDRDLPDADVVIATWWETGPWVSRLSPQKGAKAFFLQHYETWGGDPPKVDAAWQLPLHKIVISRWLQNIARDKFGDADVSYVPNSVDLKLFNAPPRSRQTKPTIGFLYNPAWFKGTGVALKAIELIRQQMPEVQVVAFGLNAPRHFYPLPEGTRYTINPPQAEIKDIYAQCDVWMCASRSEGFYLPMLEAMACRCPVVSTKVGGPVDTIREGENGHLVDVDDYNALSARVMDVLRLSDENWHKMSDAAYATACRYTWQDAAILMEDALKQLVARPHTVRRLAV